MQVLYNLAMEGGGKKEWAACAARFDKPSFYRPMVEGQDMLAGLHANTHLAQASVAVLGAVLCGALLCCIALHPACACGSFLPLRFSS